MRSPPHGLARLSEGARVRESRMRTRPQAAHARRPARIQRPAVHMTRRQVECALREDSLASVCIVLLTCDKCCTWACLLLADIERCVPRVVHSCACAGWKQVIVLVASAPHGTREHLHTCTRKQAPLPTCTCMFCLGNVRRKRIGC